MNGNTAVTDHLRGLEPVACLCQNDCYKTSRSGGYNVMMRITRICADQPLAPGFAIQLSKQAKEYVGRVLRLREGDPITLFNGDGYDYPARLTGSGPDISAQVLAREPPAAAEAGVAITLVQAIARGEKMDWIIQKATELGVERVVPVSTQRSEVRLDAERADKRLAHWRKVATSACEQCGRARIPAIDAPQTLHAAADIASDLRIFFHPESSVRLSDTHLRVGSIAMAIGPEGGFDDREHALLDRAGWRPLRLGPRILRTETAGLAAIAAVLALIGEL